jgi:biopolymer transport protein ExbD
MQRQRRIASFTAGELNLTAMIDVAFQLLSFFILTSKPVDVLADLDVSRPSPIVSDKIKNEPQKNPLTITVNPDGKYMLNERRISLANLDEFLCGIGEIGKDYTILLSCKPESSHADMVAVLDICAKAGLNKLSVLSVN